MTLDDLLAREAVRDLVARYNSYGDSGKFDLLWPLFVPDAVMEIVSAGGERVRHTGLAEIKRIFTGANDRVVAQSDATLAAPFYIRHSTATHQIDLVDADHATGRCYFSVIVGQVGGPVGGLDHWGRYVDQYVRRYGAWRFQRRVVFVDGSATGSWFAST
jgi:SnoaL-like domain